MAVDRAEEHNPGDDGSGEGLRALPWVLLAALPFAVIYLVHFLNPAGIGTGFIHWDMPYYAANGREIFERGNGFAYPNPYDPDPNAPVIYFHWLLWIFGLLITRLGLDPGTVFVAWGVAFATLMSTATWFLVRQVLPNRALQNQLFLLTIWGGGLLCYGAIAASAITGEPLDDILVFDPRNGWWFLNWGRNLIFPTESTYHLIVAGCWLLALRGRHWWALALGALLAATHPWSGLEILVTFVGFHGLRLAVADRRTALPMFLTACGALAAFLLYNFAFLDSFETHRALRQTWQIDWSLSWTTILLAWSPVALLAGAGVMSGVRAEAVKGSGGAVRWAAIRRYLGRNEAILLVAAGSAFLLSIHDRFITPTQPAHFTRGYVWMPLMLLGLPVLQRALLSARVRLAPTGFGLAMVTLIFVASFDNFVFVAAKSHWQAGEAALFLLTPDQRGMFAEIEESGLTGVTLTADARLGYLLATYTPLTPYHGHDSNTPNGPVRKGHIERYFTGMDPGSIEWLNDIQYVLVASGETRTVDPAQLETWQPLIRYGDLTLYEAGKAGTPAE